MRRNRRILDGALRVSLVPEEGADRLLRRVLVLLLALGFFLFDGRRLFLLRRLGFR